MIMDSDKCHYPKVRQQARDPGEPMVWRQLEYGDPEDLMNQVLTRRFEAQEELMFPLRRGTSWCSNLKVIMQKNFQSEVAFHLRPSTVGCQLSVIVTKHPRPSTCKEKKNLFFKD